MSLPKQKFREIVCQLLYGLEMGHIEKGQMVPFLTKELKIPKRVALSTIEQAELVFKKCQDLDKLIADTSQSWSLDRIQKMELSILRLGVFELLFEPDLPAAVVISEAIRLCKKFSTPDSVQFVNGVLDAVKTAQGL